MWDWQYSTKHCYEYVLCLVMLMILNNLWCSQRVQINRFLKTWLVSNWNHRMTWSLLMSKNHPYSVKLCQVFGVMVNCLILISVCYYSELRGAISVLLMSSIFTNESSIGCLEIIEHKWLCLVTKYDILIK
jgi:hypothetical protein